MFGLCSVSEPPMNEKRLLLVAPLLRECGGKWWKSALHDVSEGTDTFPWLVRNV